MARTFAPIVPPSDPRQCAPWLNKELRRISTALQQGQKGMAAVARGEAPDASGTPLVDLSGVFLLAGRVSNQIGAGGTQAGGSLTLTSTSSPTKGFIYLGVSTAAARIAFDETNCYLGIGTNTPIARVHAHLPSTGTSGVNQLGTHFAEYSVTVAGLDKNILALAAYANNASSYDVAFVSGGSNPLNGLGSIYFTDYNATGASGTGLRFAYGTYAPGTTNFVHLQVGGLDNAGASKNRNLLIVGFNDNCGALLEEHFNYVYIRSVGTTADTVVRWGLNGDNPNTRTGTAAGDQPIMTIHAAPTLGSQYSTALLLQTGAAFSGTENANAKLATFLMKTGDTGNAGNTVFHVDRWGRIGLFNPGNGAITSRITGRFSDIAIEDNASGASVPVIHWQLINTNSWSDGAAKGVYQMRFGFLQTSSRWSIITGDNQAGSGTPNILDRLGLNAQAVFICNATVQPSGDFTPPTAMLHIKSALAATDVLLKLQRRASQSVDIATILDSNGTTALSGLDSAGAYYLVAGAGAGKVYTSDANGVGSWQAASGGTHDILSATHTDTLTASVVRGDLIVGNTTPKWSRLAKGSAKQVLAMNSGGNDPEWATLDDTYIANRTRSVYIPFTEFIEDGPTIPSAYLVEGGSGGAVFPDNIKYLELPNAAAPQFMAVFQMPLDYVSGGAISWKLKFMSYGIGTGNVALRFYIKNISEAETATGTADSSVIDTPVYTPPSGTTDELDTYTISTYNTNIVAGDLVRISFRRSGSVAGDTYNDALPFLGLMVEYAAVL